ncbi:MAG: hypothetical protein ACLVJ6_01820 [Merdibacter sp.]
MKLRKLSMVFLLALSLLSGCQRTRYQVLVSCYPLQYLVEQIAGERVSCELLSENTLIQRAGIAENYKELLNQSDALFILRPWNPIMRSMRTRSMRQGWIRSTLVISWAASRLNARRSR